MLPSKACICNRNCEPKQQITKTHKADTKRLTWSPVDGVRDSKGANLVPDHLIQLLLQLWCGLGALSQDHICIDALPLDVVVNPACSCNCEATAC